MLVTRVLGDCPGCGKAACFGNVDIFRDHVLRGCQYCKYSTSVYLPPLKKAILYLDQFFFSGTFRGGEQRFVQVAERIRHLSALQLLLVPYSSIHEDETHLWERRDELYDFIKTTSRGHEFAAAYDVERTQVIKGFRAWLAGEPPKYILEERDALNGDVHNWDSYFRIEVGRYMGDIELIRELKRQTVEELVGIFDEWRKSKTTFDEDKANELTAAGRGYMNSYLEYVVRVGSGDYDALLNSPIVSMVMEQMVHCLPQDMLPDEQLRLCARFFGSEHFALLPYHSIEASAFAALKAIVKAGAYVNQEKALSRLNGFFYDIKHISTYAPYCQGFVLDQPMAELMAHPGVALEERYGVKVFCLNNWDALLAWLDGLEAGMTDEHKAGLAAAYP